jgi:hypothetical protein
MNIKLKLVLAAVAVSLLAASVIFATPAPKFQPGEFVTVTDQRDVSLKVIAQRHCVPFTGSCTYDLDATGGSDYDAHRISEVRLTPYPIGRL